MQRREENKTSKGQDHSGDLVTDKRATLMDLQKRKRSFEKRHKSKEVIFRRETRNCSGNEHTKSDLPCNFNIKQDYLTNLSFTAIHNF
jgi:hypothetical protein